MDAPIKPKSRHVPLLPTNDSRLADLAVFAAAHWLTEPWLTLRFVTAAAFQTKSLAYQAAVASRQQIGSVRPIDADEILNLDEQIEANLYRLKNRLIDKYDKQTALAHYPTLGIIKTNKTYTLDRDRTKRAAALLTLVQGLKTEKLEDGAYGTAFWQPLTARYNELVQQLTDTSGAISQAVNAKDTLRNEVETILSSLAKALDANSPSDPDYKAELRAWATSAKSTAEPDELLQAVKSKKPRRTNPAGLFFILPARYRITVSTASWAATLPLRARTAAAMPAASKPHSL